MKLQEIILIFLLISYCFVTTEDDICDKKFRDSLSDNCEAIISGKCKYDEDASSPCFSINNCGDADGKTQDDCKKIIPEDYKHYKCVWSSSDQKCKQEKRVCTDFRRLGRGVNFDEVCEDLPSGENGKVCTLDRNDNCYPDYPQCTDITSETNCDINNIPTDKFVKCVWNNTATPASCKPKPRLCTEYSYLNPGWASEANCHLLDTADENKTCIYRDGGCHEEYPECSVYDGHQTNCEQKIPLNSEKTTFNYLKKCVYVTSDNKCIEVDRKCSDFTVNYPDYDLSQRCEKLVASDTKKHCFYDETLSSGNKCIEQYKDCNLYDQNEIGKTRAGCEKIKLADENQKCIYIKKEHKCELKSIFSNCGDYTGGDKKICEKILSPKTNSYCVLDKDKTCKEREFYCEEALKKYDCLIYAKPFDSNKKCVFDPNNNICYEQYKGCEDYDKNEEDYCNNTIYYFNGEICFLDSDKCKSKNKKCEEASDEDECRLIEKTGVKNTERKLCDWATVITISESSVQTVQKCIENYKYCSDYRGRDSETCSNIKPYNEKGDGLDLGYKCEIRDNNVGCEKVPRECSEAGTNPILCALFSPNIRNKNKKYCAFYRGQCTEHYKTCENYDDDYINQYTCAGIIVQDNYLNTKCEKETDSTTNKQRCVSKKACDIYNKFDYQYLCQSIDPKCKYYGNNRCYEDQKSCEDIIFYSADKADENVCKSIIPSDADKICVLKEDKSGCETVNREKYPIYYAINKNNNNSSAMIKNGMVTLVLILIGLIF